ncbi:MAG TPA: DUF6036 family nucleotidyltransferase [Steroidobacteraceae bacterium]|nr:DUF6036 family nucleotidyltransferase [Steroidobacteraceae bacterium]
MKKQQVDHILRAAGRITGEKQFIIIGSQSLHGKYPDVPDEILTSFEVDLITSKHADRTEWLNVIGVDSPFHETFGYYADPVDVSTATLPRGWKGRLVSLPPGDTEGVRGLCLEPHDLAIAKYAAAREKDLIFTHELARRGIISEERLLSLLDRTPVDAELRERMRGQIARDFHAERGIDNRAAVKQQQMASAVDDLEAIRARGRAEWLKQRRQAGVTAATSDLTRKRDTTKQGKSEHDSGASPDDDECE